MTSPKAYVRAGQVIEVEPGDFLYRRDFLEYSDERLHLRVTHVPATYFGISQEWVSLLGVTLQPSGEDVAHVCVIVRTRVLPGYREPRRAGPFDDPQATPPIE